MSATQFPSSSATSSSLPHWTPSAKTEGSTSLTRTLSCASIAWPATASQNLATKQITPNPDLHFKPVVGKGREERFALVRHFFNTVLDRIYGSQESALAKIVAPSSDRTCRLLYDGEKPVGVLVVKKGLTLEHYPNSLEIKTLALLDKNASGKGYGSALLQKVEQIASDLRANSIHVTVNSSVPESIDFFQKKGFFMACHLKGIGKEGTQEFLFVKELSQEAEKTAQVAKQSLSTKGTKRKSPEKAPEPRSFTSAENQSTSFPPSRTYYTAKRSETTRPLEVTLKKPYVKAIQDGSKTVEGRINS